MTDFPSPQAHIKPWSSPDARYSADWDSHDVLLPEGVTEQVLSRVVGMSPSFVRKVVETRGGRYSVRDVHRLLEHDCYGETFIPRHAIVSYLSTFSEPEAVEGNVFPTEGGVGLFCDDAVTFIERSPFTANSVVTSPPYWGMRTYADPTTRVWADGENCVYGQEQTPEGYLRHTTEVLEKLWHMLDDDGSIWWNIMDSHNTRTPVRGSASETLAAMGGRGEPVSWRDQPLKRYSSGHSVLKDGDLCLIPFKVAERATRLGYSLKSVITWVKPHTLPEPHHQRRVSRSSECVLHLTKRRTSAFHRDEFASLPAQWGGRNAKYESDKLSDVWVIETSPGLDGHGAQFPVALPGRCISLSTLPGQVVFDPFMGLGNTGVAAVHLGRRFVGVDVSPTYVESARERVLSLPYQP